MYVNPEQVAYVKSVNSLTTRIQLVGNVKLIVRGSARGVIGMLGATVQQGKKAGEL
ncbi:hypothetical protein SEA_DUMPTRUCK_59 [Gordonia phage DumpTruck]|nr:hypothetical protein SEA_DUMPTRUCK_59 [Gordonia phage DumpTruck]